MSNESRPQGNDPADCAGKEGKKKFSVPAEVFGHFRSRRQKTDVRLKRKVYRQGQSFFPMKDDNSQQEDNNKQPDNTCNVILLVLSQELGLHL